MKRGIVIASLMLATMFVTMGYLPLVQSSADRVQMTVDLEFDDSGIPVTTGNLVVNDIDKDCSHTYSNSGDGSFEVDTDDLPAFDYGDILEIYGEDVTYGGVDYTSCHVEIEAGSSWNGLNPEVKLYSMNGVSVVAKPVAYEQNGMMWGQAKWDSTPLGTYSYTANGGTISLKIIFSETNNEPGVGTYIWEYDWYLKIVNGGNSKQVKGSDTVPVGGEDPGCSDPSITLPFTRNEIGAGTGGNVHIWVDYEKHDVSNGGDTIVKSGSLPSSGTYSTGIILV